MAKNEFDVFDLTRASEWRRCLASLPVEQQDIYYTPEYYKLYEDNGDGKALCFVYQDESGIALYPFLLNKINDLGYELDRDYYDIQGAYGYNGVVSSTRNRGFSQRFHEALESYTKEKRIVAEFTRFHPIICNAGFSEAYMRVEFNRNTIALNLLNTEKSSISECYSHQARKKLNHAKNQNVTCRDTRSQEDLAAFIKIYYETMFHLGAKAQYFFPAGYFTALMDDLKDNTRLFIAEYQNDIVGGLMSFRYGPYAHNHLSAAKVDLKHLGINVILQDMAISDAKAAGCAVFSFGGGRTTEPDDTLLKFKRNFSRDDRQFFIGTKVHLPDVYKHLIIHWTHKQHSIAGLKSNMFLCYRELD